MGRLAAPQNAVCLKSAYKMYLTRPSSYSNRKQSEGKVQTSDALQKGSEMVAGGYALYGSATMMVLSVGKGNGVHGFMLDPVSNYHFQCGAQVYLFFSISGWRLSHLLCTPDILSSILGRDTKSEFVYFFEDL